MRTMLICTAMMIATGDGFAQDVPSVTAHERAAAELIEVLQMERLATASVDVVAQAMSNPAMVSAEQAAVMTAFTEVMVEFNREFMSWEHLRPEYIRLYMEAFTEAEMRELIAFYSTPIGQKTLEVTPELMRQGVEISQRLMQQHMPELERRLLLRVRETGGFE